MYKTTIFKCYNISATSVKKMFKLVFPKFRPLPQILGNIENIVLVEITGAVNENIFTSLKEVCRKVKISKSQNV